MLSTMKNLWHIYILYCLLIRSDMIFGNDPDLLWPLDNTTYMTEVIQSSTTVIDSSQCSLNVGSQPPPGYSNSVLSLDGNTILDLDVVFSQDALDKKEYSFCMMVRPTVTNAALFHYKPTDQTRQFREMALYVDAGNVYMKRVLSNKVELSAAGSSQINVNTWNFIGFGIEYGSGKMIVHLNSVKIINEENNFVEDVQFIVPGVLRVGGMMDQSRPNLTGQVACAAFFMKKDPKEGDVEKECKTTRTTSIPDCTPTPLERSNTKAGYFALVSDIKLNALHQLAVYRKCSRLRCAVACLRQTGCWYYQYDNSVTKCTDCVLYDSSLSTWVVIGPMVSNLYKWVA